MYNYTYNMCNSIHILYSIVLLFFDILTYSEYCKYDTCYFFFDRIAKYICENRYNIESVI